MIGGWLLAMALAWAAPSLDEVLSAVDARVPQLAAAEAKLREAEAKLLKSRGAFDPVLKGKIGRYGGKDPRDLGNVEVMVPTAFGPSVELGYSVGRGDFPPYDGDRETPEGGEWRVAAEFPLLDGLGLPEARAELWRARASVALAGAKQDSERLKVRLKAAQAYWKWLSSVAKRQVEANLLDQAQDRDVALRRQVDEGTRARLDQVDNERALFQRRDALAQADLDVARSALVLSLWYRDAQARPIVIEADEETRFETSERSVPALEQDLERVDLRPDLRSLDALLEAARVDRARAANALWPDLSLSGEAIRPLRPEEKPELFAGASVKLPVAMRKERGQKAQADAALEGLQERRRATFDGARAEVQAVRVALQTSWQRVGWTRDGEDRAAEVVRLERRRFELGGGDLFQLLARERNLATAQKDAIEAALDYELAVADRDAALGVLPGRTSSAE